MVRKIAFFKIIQLLLGRVKFGFDLCFIVTDENSLAVVDPRPNQIVQFFGVNDRCFGQSFKRILGVKTAKTGGVQLIG